MNTKKLSYWPIQFFRHRPLLPFVKRGFLIVLACGLLAINGADVLRYMIAQNEVQKLANNDEMKRQDLEQVSDYALYSKCQEFDKNGLLNDAWRDCAVDVLPSLKNVSGVLPFSIMVSKRLVNHPEDLNLKTSSQAALASGWKDYRRIYDLYQAKDRLEKLRSASIFLRTDAFSNEPGLVESVERQLQEAEIAVNAPDLFKAMQIRKLKV